MAPAAGSEGLLERDPELARLRALLGTATSGAGAVPAVWGPAGIGKTALVEALHDQAADRGVRVLRARGRVLETGMAFGVMRQLMEPVVLPAGAAERRRLLAGPARFGAGALGLPGGAAPDSEFAAIHGLYWLLANLAGRTPVLLTVDDVQWVDGPSLSWLAYLGPRAADLPVLMMVTAREGDAGAQRPAADAVLRDGAAHRFLLAALSPASVAALVRRELGRAASAGFCAACWELTSGNPLYVRELLAAMRTAGLTGSEDSIVALRALAPSAVGASVLARLAGMGPDAVELVQAVAVLGSRHEVAVAAELAGLHPPAAEMIADELAAAQILTSARPLDFFHPLIGEAIYAGMAAGAQRLAHRRAATILDRTGATDSVAAHLLMTGPAGDEWVSLEMLRARLDDMPDAPVRLLVAAAQAAMRRAEPGDVAEQMIMRALTRH